MEIITATEVIIRFNEQSDEIKKEHIVEIFKAENIHRNLIINVMNKVKKLVYYIEYDENMYICDTIHDELKSKGFIIEHNSDGIIITTKQKYLDAYHKSNL